MQVQRIKQPTGRISFDLLDDGGLPVAEISGFLRYLESRDYSPHTISAYAYDLLHFSRFLVQEGLTYADFRPAHALALVVYLRAQPVRRPAQRTSLVRCTTEQGQPTTCLSAPAVNLVQPRRNKSERYGSLWKGEREEGEHEHAPSKRDPLESQFGAARGTATPGAPLHESPTAGASWEDHSGSSSRSQQYEDHPGPAGGS